MAWRWLGSVSAKASMWRDGGVTAAHVAVVWKRGGGGVGEGIGKRAFFLRFRGFLRGAGKVRLTSFDFHVIMVRLIRQTR